jgi:osmotically-inducible protein OsmY
MGPAALGLTLAIGTWTGAGEPKPAPPAQQPKDTGQRIGGAVDSVVQSVKRGAQATSETVADQFHKIRTSVHDMGLHARVYSRLHWDKDLYNCPIEVEVKESTAILRGSVPNLQVKARATELARDTLGIDRVDDHLTIEPAATTGNTRTGAPTKP